MNHFALHRVYGVCLPVGRNSEVRDLPQVIHTVKHGKDLLGVSHKVWVDVIDVTLTSTEKKKELR